MFAIDWPGWAGAKTADAAGETLEAYRERYLPVAAGAGLGDEFEAAGPLDVFEDRVGTGSVDFWGISFSPSETEHGPMTEDELERKIALFPILLGVLRTGRGPGLGGDAQGAARWWTGPGPDHPSHDPHRERGLRQEGRPPHPEEGALAPGALQEYREDYILAIRAYDGEVEKPMRSWTLPFLIRHSAYHTMDHAWEMEDKDLSTERQA